MHRSFFPAILVGMCAAVPLFAAPNTSKKSDEKDIPLSADFTQAVITFDYRGGGLRRTSEEPVLRIYAHGPVHVANPWGRSKEVKTTISTKELQGLLQTIISKHYFFDLDGEAIQTAVRESQRANGTFTKVLDDSTVTIRVQTADMDHTVSFYALRLYAQQHPNVESLQHLDAVRKQMDHLLSILHAGGEENALKYLKLANDELAKAAPDGPALTLDDLQYCGQAADGKRRMQFYRATRNKANALVSYSSVTIEDPEDSEPQITVSTK